MRNAKGNPSRRGKKHQSEENRVNQKTNGGKQIKWWQLATTKILNIKKRELEQKVTFQKQSYLQIDY